MLFERRYHPSTDPDSEFSRVLAGGDVSTSGVMVTPESALRVSAWLACVRIISETAGSLPFITYKRL
ncbi:MAG: phage portal protein, partial [Bacteroidetes bacterium]|nr:phage portal protein [Bacteroidota bacterium]